MKFTPKLQKGRLIRRYKRFLADILDESGELLTIHCANTGSMKNCLVENSSVWYSSSDNPKRKLAHSWEIASSANGGKIGVNTARANHLVREALEAGLVIDEDILELKPEQRFGQEKSRVDFWLRTAQGQCFIEVKNLTLCEGQGKGFFPDSVSTRGTRHIRELCHELAKGHRAILVFCVQHSEIFKVGPARHIDPEYARTLDEGLSLGLEIVALKAELSDTEIVLKERLEFCKDLPV